MGMGVTPPKLALCRRRLSFCSRIPGVTVPKSLLDEFEAEEKLVKAFNCRHSQIVIGTPIKPPHMRCASVGSYETSSPCANDHHQYDQECDIIDNNKSGYVTEAVLDDERCWKEGSDGKLSNLQEWSFPTGDDPVTGDKYDTTNNIAFVEIV